MDAVASGYNVVLCFIGISGPEISEERVAMRMSQGGHYVPPDKLIIRFPRTVANLKAAIQPLPMVLIFDNDVLLWPSEASLSSVTESPLSLLNRFPNGCVLCLTNSSGSSDAAARRRLAIYSWVSRYGATPERPQLQASAIPLLYRAAISALGSWIGLPSGCGSQQSGKKREKAAVKMLQSFDTRFAGDT